MVSEVMKRKLDTRFPASRIKKIMQTDEDVGKIALAVPLLVSKALELFLQDLCDRTYDITLKRGAKIMSSAHLKQCVHNFSVFDFLKETVSRVPDVGFSDVGGEDRSSRRRKAVDDEGNVTDEESKRSKRQEMPHNSRGRGRGRGRGRRTVSHGTEWDISHHNKCEDGPDASPQHHEKLKQGENEFGRTELKENSTMTSSRIPVRDFDLNLDLDENGFAMVNPIPAVPASSTITAREMKQDEYKAWLPLTYMDKMTGDPLQLVVTDKRIDEDEEDYDNED